MFEITIDYLILIILKKDEAINILLMEINKYKHIYMQTLQSQVQDSVGNEETHEETQGQANHESREASAPGFAAWPRSSFRRKSPHAHMASCLAANWFTYICLRIQQDIQRFTCKTCQNNFIDKN